MSYTIDTPINKFVDKVNDNNLFNALKKLKPDSPLLSPSVIKAFVDASRKYNIDPIYLLAHAILESNWGKSNFAVNRNNLFGYMAYDSNPDAAASFKTKEDAIWFQAKFVSEKYLNPGGKWYGGSPTLRGMNVRYATAGHWGKAIADIAKLIDAKLGNETASPPKPKPKLDFYASQRNVTIVSEQGANIRSYPSVKDSVVNAVPKGTTVAVDGYVIGEAVAGNSMWWKLKGADQYLWVGTTNVIPKEAVPKVETIEDEPKKETAPLPSPDPKQDNELLVKQIEELKKNNSRLLNEVLAKDKKVFDLEFSKGEMAAKVMDLESSLNSVMAMKEVNQQLSLQIEAYKGKVKEVTNERNNAFVEAFDGWNLLQINAGFSNIIKSPILFVRILGLVLGALRNDYVLGWKKGAKIYKQ